MPTKPARAKLPGKGKTPANKTYGGGGGHQGGITVPKSSRKTPGAIRKARVSILRARIAVISAQKNLMEKRLGGLMEAPKRLPYSATLPSPTKKVPKTRMPRRK